MEDHDSHRKFADDIKRRNTGLQNGYVDPTQFSSYTGFARSYRTKPYNKEKKRLENMYDYARDWAVARLQVREIDVVILV